MSDYQHPDVWQLLFNQTPPALRWVFGILTLGVFTLAGHLYSRQQARLAMLEGQAQDFVKRSELEPIVRDLRADIRLVLRRVDGLYDHRGRDHDG